MKLPEAKEIKGFVDHFIYQNPVNGYKIFVLISRGKEVTCVGNCRDLEQGENLEAEGEYVLNPTYGPQFAIRTYKVVPPADAESMERYLGSGAIKGVGAALAARIVKTFRDETFRIIEEEPERLAEIKGISMRKAMDIAVQLEEKRDLRDAMVYLGKYHISQALAVKIYEKYGTDLYDVMKENPYRLAEDISGVGFQTADRIAMEMGMPMNSQFRVRCGILYTLQQSIGEGHCYLPEEELVERSAAELQTEGDLVRGELQGLEIEKKLYRLGDRIYTSLLYHTELGVARRMQELLVTFPEPSEREEERMEKEIGTLAVSEGMTVDPLQIRAVTEAVQNGIFLLSGGPGTGKTTTINLMIRYFMSKGMDLLLAAPTGRAAKRMSEATGFEAVTIHRLLEVGGGMGEDTHAVFQKNQDNPLETDVVIIDEMSMVDVLLFHALLKAILPGTRLILVGDVDQLPSVGPGQVLRDLMESGMYPYIRLEKIFRQATSSDIVVNAHKINAGEQIRLDTDSKDFLFLERKDADVIKQITVWMMRDKLPGYVHAQVSDIQVLTPMKKGPLGCIELNAFLQSVLNPEAPGKSECLAGDHRFREGDKVMQTRNDYRIEWEIRGSYGQVIDSGQGVFNGDMGVIRSISEAAGSMEVEYDDGKIVTYPLNALEDLELAYAITIHKAQGSEYPAVILPLLDPPRMLRYRNLLYTGITRARSCVVLLGSSDTVRRMIEETGERERYSSLQDMIRALKEEG